MGSLWRFGSVGRPCELDCPIKVAFAKPPHQLSTRPLHRREAATKAEMMHVSNQLYSPIKPWQTRILRLQPGQPHEPISCKLEVAELVCFEGIGLSGEPELVQFEALSYSWGRPAFTDSIMCNNVHFPVTPNLADALWHFRLPGKERLLWVDAFCIHQANLSEKARQVEIMYDIFSKAKRVLAWLGIPSPEQIPLMNLMVAGPDDHKPWEALENRSHGIGCQLHDLHRITDEFLKETAWFRRAWIRQEVHAARDLQMFCGPYRFHFNSLTSISESLARAQSGFVPGSVGVHNSFSAFQILKADYIGREWPVRGHAPESQIWTDMLLESAFFDSTLPQDKVYAVLGMATATVRDNPSIKALNLRTISKGLEVDYTKPLSLVYLNTMNMLRQMSPNLPILLAFRSCNNVVIDDLPSWFPDIRTAPSGVIWADHDMRRRGIFIEEYAEDGSITVCGDTFAAVGSEDPFRHQVTFQKALAENFPDEKVDLSALPLRLYGCHRGMNGLLILPIACRRLIEKCSFSLVNLQLTGQKPRESQDNKASFHLIALTPRATTVGDILTRLEGSSAAFLLRPSARIRGRYYFLGPVLVFYAKREEAESWQLLDLDSEACDWVSQAEGRTKYHIC